MGKYFFKKMTDLQTQIVNPESIVITNPTLLIIIVGYSDSIVSPRNSVVNIYIVVIGMLLKVNTIA